MEVISIVKELTDEDTLYDDEDEDSKEEVDSKSNMEYAAQLVTAMVRRK